MKTHSYKKKKKKKKKKSGDVFIICSDISQTDN